MHCPGCWESGKFSVLGVESQGAAGVQVSSEVQCRWVHWWRSRAGGVEVSRGGKGVQRGKEMDKKCGD